MNIKNALAIATILTISATGVVGTTASTASAATSAASVSTVKVTDKDVATAKANIDLAVAKETAANKDYKAKVAAHSKLTRWAVQYNKLADVKKKVAAKKKTAANVRSARHYTNRAKVVRNQRNAMGKLSQIALTNYRAAVKQTATAKANYNYLLTSKQNGQEVPTTSIPAPIVNGSITSGPQNKTAANQSYYNKISGDVKVNHASSKCVYDSSKRGYVIQSVWKVTGSYFAQDSLDFSNDVPVTKNYLNSTMTHISSREIGNDPLDTYYGFVDTTAVDLIGWGTDQFSSADHVKVKGTSPAVDVKCR